MADPDVLLREGDLGGARAALVEIVRARPSDQQARMFLFQLFAVAGEWDKAKTQLEAIAQLSAEAQMLAVTYKQAIEAEKLRVAVFAGTQPMPVLMGEDGWARDLGASITLLAKGDVTGAEAARDAAFDAAPDTPGSFEGQRFEWIANADVRFGPAIEIIIGGKYGLIAFDQIAGITSSGPRDLRDTVWYPVEVAFRSGHSAAAFLPARYPGSETSGHTAEQLARSTSWTDREWGQEGCGQQLLSFSQGDDRGLLELRHLAFDE